MKCLQEEAAKTESARKSFGLMLNFILTSCGIQHSPAAKKFLAGKFLGGSKTTLYNKAMPIANRPETNSMLMVNDPHNVSGHSSKAKDGDSDKKKKLVSKKRAIPDSSSPSAIEKKKKPKTKKESSNSEAVPTAP